jgi:hypothetical protein
LSPVLHLRPGQVAEAYILEPSSTEVILMRQYDTGSAEDTSLALPPLPHNRMSLPFVGPFQYAMKTGRAQDRS